MASFLAQQKTTDENFSLTFMEGNVETEQEQELRSVLSHRLAKNSVYGDRCE